MLIPGKNLPSVREQVELCRNIASQLVSTENSRSKGATMFFKRVKKAHTWEVPQRDSDEQRAIEEEDDEFMRKKLAETLLNGTEKSASKNLSLVMNPRGRIHSLSSLKAEGVIVVEHDAVQPDLMSRLMKDLQSPEANPRAAELFAKRRAALEKLEEEQLKQQQQQQQQQQQIPVISYIPQTAPTFSPPQCQQQQLTSPPSMPSIPTPVTLKTAPPDYATKVPLKPIQPTTNGTFNRPSFANQSVDVSNKRYSLLDPDIFVPSVTCNISSSPWLRVPTSVKAPSPWKSGATPVVKSVSPVPPPSNCTQSTDTLTRNLFNNQLAKSNSVNTTTKTTVTTNDATPFNGVNSNSNNADNYYNYFYQTLKYSNPYQNLPESILL